MKNYLQAAKEAEFALNNGEYHACVEILRPLIERFSASSKEGINLRMLLITAYSGINKNDEALKLCKELAKSRSPQIRENAKSLIEILNSPNLKTPENWNINFENNVQNINNYDDSKSISKKLNNKKKFIKISETPTGETKPFKQGFVIITFVLLVLLISLLSGCVKIENNLDLRDLDSINIDLEIETKYLDKIPWQINFEKEIIKNFKHLTTEYDDEKFFIKDRGLSINEVNSTLNKFIKIASETTPINFEDIKIDHSEKDYFFIKKHFFSIIFNLTNVENIENLDMSIKISNPSKPIILNEVNNIQIINGDINWELIPGRLNQIKYIYWNWNKLFLSFAITIFIVFLGYLIKKSRYELGSDLPKLPS